MNELNDIDNSVTSRQPNELLQIILYEFWLQLSNSSKIVTDLTILNLACKNNIKDYTYPPVTFLLHFSGL